MCCTSHLVHALLITSLPLTNITHPPTPCNVADSALNRPCVLHLVVKHLLNPLVLRFRQIPTLPLDLHNIFVSTGELNKKKHTFFFILFMHLSSIEFLWKISLRCFPVKCSSVMQTNMNLTKPLFFFSSGVKLEQN